MGHYLSSWQDVAREPRKSRPGCYPAGAERCSEPASGHFPHHFYFLSVGVSSEHKWIDTAGPRPAWLRGSGRTAPGCYGKGHPDFTLMDGSDSVAESELSRAPWQQRAMNGEHGAGTWSNLIDLTQTLWENIGLALLAQYPICKLLFSHSWLFPLWGHRHRFFFL